VELWRRTLGDHVVWPEAILGLGQFSGTYDNFYINQSVYVEESNKRLLKALSTQSQA
jgi:hypothetical protein